MTVLCIDTIWDVPRHGVVHISGRQVFVVAFSVRRYDVDWMDADDRTFTNDLAIFDIYVDFRPGLRTRWRPWIYAYSTKVAHRLAPYEKECPNMCGYDFAIQAGRLAVAAHWWELLRKRFPSYDPELEATALKEN